MYVGDWKLENGERERISLEEYEHEVLAFLPSGYTEDQLVEVRREIACSHEFGRDVRVAAERAHFAATAWAIAACMEVGR